MVVYASAETWPSGRRRSPAKGVGSEGSRGFESLRLRHISIPVESARTLSVVSSHKNMVFSLIVFLLTSLRYPLYSFSAWYEMWYFVKWLFVAIVHYSSPLAVIEAGQVTPVELFIVMCEIV